MSPEEREEKLIQAREAHGKPFVTEIKIQRTKEPSLLLQDINRRSAEMAKPKDQRKIKMVKK